MTNVLTLRALGDNFIYLHEYEDRRVFVVDPGEAGVVLETLQQRSLTLTMILLTHHHWDHVGGVSELTAQTGCDVIGVGHSLLPTPDRTVSDGEVLTLGAAQVHVIATPGHTASSVCYHVEPGPGEPAGTVYTGDTLFVGGCGRLLECDASTMWRSLQKLAALPDETLVYCGHDYTLENYEFATSIAPEMPALQDRLEQVEKAVEYGQATVPSTLTQEKATNIFLLADHPQVREALAMPDAASEDVFAELRRRKDIFG